MIMLKVPVIISPKEGHAITAGGFLWYERGCACLPDSVWPRVRALRRRPRARRSLSRVRKVQVQIGYIFFLLLRGSLACLRWVCLDVCTRPGALRVLLRRAA